MSNLCLAKNRIILWGFPKLLVVEGGSVLSVQSKNPSEELVSWLLLLCGLSCSVMLAVRITCQVCFLGQVYMGGITWLFRCREPVFSVLLSLLFKLRDSLRNTFVISVCWCIMNNTVGGLTSFMNSSCSGVNIRKWAYCLSVVIVYHNCDKLHIW